MRRGRVIKTEDGTATVVFDSLGIQRRAQVMRGVEVSEGDAAIVIFSPDSSDCVIIGVVD